MSFPHMTSNTGTWKGNKESMREEVIAIEKSGPSSLYMPCVPQINFQGMGNIKPSYEFKELQY